MKLNLWKESKEFAHLRERLMASAGPIRVGDSSSAEILAINDGLKLVAFFFHGAVLVEGDSWNAIL